MNSGYTKAIIFAVIVGIVCSVFGLEFGRLQILNETYTCEKDINEVWQCKENK